VLRNGHIVTVDGTFSIAEAVAVTDGVIIAVGTDAAVSKAIGPDTIDVDLAGRTVMPGIVDPHTHHMQVVAPDQAAMLAAQSYMLSVGTTTSGAPSVRPDHLEAFEALNERGLLTQRIHLYLNYNGVCGAREDIDFFQDRGFGQDPQLRLAIAGVKLFADGGTCNGFAISEAFLDSTPDGLKDRGFIGNGDLYVRAAEVSRVVRAVDAAGGITVVHAIGDVAISEALAGLAEAYETQPFRQHQRIDHNSFSSLLSDEDLSIYGTVDMTPVVFPQPFANGCSADTADVWQSILPPRFFDSLEGTARLRASNPGMKISWHGDAPSLPGDPFHLMFTLVTGGAVDLDTGATCFPEAWSGWHAVDVAEAVRMMTINAAAAMGIDEDVGSIEVGKVADMIVLANDILGPDAATAIAFNEVTATLIDGVTQYCSGQICSDLLRSVDDAPTGECVAAPDGIEDWWPGEHGGEDVVGDNRAELLGATRVVPGFVGNALRLDRSSVALMSQPRLGDGFTIEGWINLDASAFDEWQTIFNNNQVFIRKNAPAEGGGFAVFVKLADGTVEPRAQSFSSTQPETWTHIAARWDTETLTLYIDGEPSGSAVRSGTLIANAVGPRIGSGEQEEVDGQEFSGVIDELTVYSRALEAGEVAAIHAAGTSGKCTP